ncbi:MAG: phospholipid carrier-dependent glycosyltransferase [Clostridiales bacterium]|nr:phospholipid carrier-dependent glycosyltransferase [Clostridiales bacterium]
MIQKKIRFVSLLSIMILIITVSLFPSAKAEENLMYNGDFQKIDSNGFPEGWFTQAWNNQPNYTLYELETQGMDDSFSVSIRNLDDNDARFCQEVSVSANTTYKLSGYIRTENISDSGWGANLSIADNYLIPEGLHGNHEQWTYFETYGMTGENQKKIEVWLRLGGYSGESDGKAYFDNISLTEVTGIPLGVTVNSWSATSFSNHNDLVNLKEESSTDKPWGKWSVISIAYALCFAFFYHFLDSGKKGLATVEIKVFEKKWTWILFSGLFLSMAIRIFLSANSPGYGPDMQCIISWGNTMAANGPGSFYEKVGFCDYPPVYMYLLGLSGLGSQGLSHLAQSVPWVAQHYMALEQIVVRFLPNVADILTAVLLYAFAKKRMSQKGATTISLFYVFNPVSFLVTAAWGQVDSIITLGIAAVIFLALEKKWKWVLPVYVFSVLTKPQALIFGPIGLAAILFSFIWNEDRQKRKKELKEMGIGLGLSIAVFLAVILPVSGNQPWNWILTLYQDTLSSYPYASLNTTNFMYLLGGNWTEMTMSITRGVAWVVGVFGFLVAMGGTALWVNHLKKRRKLPVGDKKEMTTYITCFGLVCTGVIYVMFSFLKVSYAVIGNAGIILVILWTGWIFWQGRKIEKLPLAAGTMLLGLYTFAGKMHERYIYPAIFLFFLAYLIEKDYRTLGLIIGVTCTSFFNIAIILFNNIHLGDASGHLLQDTLVFAQILSFINIILTFVAFWVFHGSANGEMKYLTPRKKTKKDTIETYTEKQMRDPLSHTMDFKKKDVLIVGIVTVLYGLLAFVNLGSTVSPQTQWTAVAQGETIILDTHSDQEYEMLYYFGINECVGGNTIGFDLATSDDLVFWDNQRNIILNNPGDPSYCFKWEYVKENGDNPAALKGRYIKITADTVGLNIWEVVVRDKEKMILPLSVKEHLVPKNQELQTQADALIDEQTSFMGAEPGWYNSTYFDEIYHARTGYEHAKGLHPYETTHPPLGKVFMSWAIQLFGMTPFAWRFAGTLVGVLMLPAMYLLAKQLTKKRHLATAAMLLMTFDLMHFTQTRIATIDSFPVLFIILAYWAMIRYMQTDIFGVGWSKRLFPLFLSGLFMGLSIASKWIGAYAGVGLALLFFWSCWRNLSMGNMAKEILDQPEMNKLPCKRQEAMKVAAKDGRKIFVITCLWCILFFIIIPLIIYTLSYIPYFSPSGGITLQKLISAQENMLRYHSEPGRGMDHYYYSPWWQWPVIGKPMYYSATSYTPEGTDASIVAMGNPAVWWGGLLALIGVFAVFLKRHFWADENNRIFHVHTKNDQPELAMILIGFASQYLPWTFVPRGTYIYHYFASVPFIILAIVVVFYWIEKKNKKLGTMLLWGFVFLAALMFIGFFPYASGATVPIKWLEWGQWLPASLPY